jgi:hypothetical protein
MLFIELETTDMTFTTEKLSKNRVAIYRDGEYLCQIMPKEVAGWIARAERSAQQDAEAKILERTYRLEAAHAYLARRAKRPIPAIQLVLL